MTHAIKRVRPRILFITTISPYPHDFGAALRVRNMLMALSACGDVDFVGYSSLSDGESWPSGETIAALSSLCRSVRVSRLPDSSPTATGSNGLSFLARSLLSKTALLHTEFAGDHLRMLVGSLAESADLIWVERLHVAYWFKEFREKIVVDVDDLEFRKYERQKTLEPKWLDRWALGHEARKLAITERASAAEYRRIVICSQQDALFWPKESRDRILVVENGTDDRLFEYPRSPKSKHQLVFVGLLAYRPNVDAVLYFYREILPLVEQQVPDVTFWIVGRSPDATILNLHDGRKVFVAPDVPDVAPFVQGSAVSVVPLRVGGGTRLKILESMALGTPVVSTTVGAEGLNLANGEEILLADRPVDFAAAVIRMLNDDRLYTAVQSKGEVAVRRRYLWSKIRENISQEIGEILSGVSALSTDHQ